MPEIHERGALVRVGTRGWDYASWTPGFYPEELPPEWRLTFYANHFNAVLVPPRTWMESPPECLEQWCADTGDSFHFVLELGACGGEHDLDEVVHRAGMLGSRVAALVAGEPADCNRLARLLPDWPVVPGWDGRGLLTDAPTPPGPGLPLIVRLAADGDLVEVVKQIARRPAGFGEIALFVDADPSVARQLRAATQLLGLART